MLLYFLFVPLACLQTDVWLARTKKWSREQNVHHYFRSDQCRSVMTLISASAGTPWGCDSTGAVLRAVATDAEVDDLQIACWCSAYGDSSPCACDSLGPAPAARARASLQSDPNLACAVTLDRELPRATHGWQVSVAVAATARLRAAQA